MNGNTKHAEEQIVGRDHGIGVRREALEDAFAHPVRDVERLVDHQGRVSFQYTGKDATVVMNEQGTVITGWPRTLARQREAQVDSRFEFLDSAGIDLLNAILQHRSPALLERIRHEDLVSQSDAEEVMSVLTKELTNNLDDDWEPTEHGLVVSSVLAQFNKARLSEWP